MSTRHFILVVNHADPTVQEVRLDFPTREAARAYLHANKDVARADGCELRSCTEPVAPAIPADAVFTLCPTCFGSGSVLTRMAVIDGCGFPDEDTCPRCWGVGRVAISVDHIPARAS